MSTALRLILAIILFSVGVIFIIAGLGGVLNPNSGILLLIGAALIALAYAVRPPKKEE